MKRSRSANPLAFNRASRSMVLVAAFALRARSAETRKMGGARPRADRMPPSTKERTSSAASSSRSRSALFTTSTTFLPQSRMSSRPPLALGQGPLGGGDEQYQVAPRHEAPAQLLVVADDGVRPRRVHDGDLPQKLVRMPLLKNTVTPIPLNRLVAVAQNDDAICRRRYALLGDLRAEQRVYEGGLPRVELANDDEQEELLEICVRPSDELCVLRRRPEVLQESYEPLQEIPLPLYQSLPALVEDPHLPASLLGAL